MSYEENKMTIDDPRWAEEVLDEDYGPLQEPTDSYYRIALPKLASPGDQSWKDLSLCLVYPSVDFFNYRDTARAKEVCGECSVQAQCLDFAIRNGEDSGVWGGMTPDERKVYVRAGNHVAHD